MALIKIKIDGCKTREVLSLMYDLHQITDVEGHPTGPVRGGKIHVKTKTMEDGNTELTEWMCDHYGRKKGKIEFLKTTGGNMKTLEWEDGYCTDYQEVYEVNAPDPLYEMFTISAKKFKIGSAEQTNAWTVDQDK
jgi:hypothetical protein